MNKMLETFETLKLEDVLSFINDFDCDSLPQKKIAFLRSFTIEPIEPYLKMMGIMMGFDFQFHYSGFNQYYQEIMDTGSEFYDFSPDVTIILIRLEDIVSEKMRNESVNEEAFNTEIENCSRLIEQILKTVRVNSNSFMLLGNFHALNNLNDGIYESQNSCSLLTLCRKLNLELLSSIKLAEGAAILDLDNFISSCGAKNYFDLRNWIVAKNPIRSSHYALFAKFMSRYFQNIFGKTRKCIVLDLDNTLWGGLAGEDGIDGVRLGDDFPGVLYKEFQQRLLHYKKRGFILAINSKNDHSDAISIIENHPHMILRRNDFSVMKINWDNKAKNCQMIAGELNIGLDSLVFIDDNPVERELVASSLPEVCVVDFPENIIGLPTILEGNIFLDKLFILEEDRLKNDMYISQTKRKEFGNYFENVEDFLKNLEMRANISCVNSATIKRAVQLSQKTNQFNLTTRRLTDADIVDKSNDLSSDVYCLHLSDKFGDNGIVGLMVIDKNNDEGTWYIDEFLLSCRVMNRRVEYAFLDFIREKAKTAGIDHIMGRYVPMQKNRVVESLYSQMGFELINEEKRLYRFDVNSAGELRHFCRIHSVNNFNRSLSESEATTYK